MLVHGGGHGGWCYQFVARILRSLTTAGFVAGLVDKGLILSTQDDYDDTAEQAAEIYRRKAAGFDAIMGSVGYGQFDGGDLSNAVVGAGGGSIKDLVIGVPPAAAEVAELTGFDDVGNAFNTLQAVPELPPELSSDYPWAFSGGELRPWDELKDLPVEKLQSFRIMLNRIGRSDDLHGEAMETAYAKVVL